MEKNLKVIRIEFKTPIVYAVVPMDENIQHFNNITLEEIVEDMVKNGHLLGILEPKVSLATFKKAKEDDWLNAAPFGEKSTDGTVKELLEKFNQED